MEASQSVPELVAAAQTHAKTHQDTLTRVDVPDASDAQRAEQRAATVALETAAVDVFSLFESRMQHHFRRGPFSRKLNALLLDAKQPDLADRFHRYYLAINVLKHGKGASYRELLASPSDLIVVKTSDDSITDETGAHTGLIDVTVPGFFEGLTKTILDAYQFLEKR